MIVVEVDVEVDVGSSGGAAWFVWIRVQCKMCWRVGSRLEFEEEGAAR